jgi:hypothetical protein
VVSLQVLDSVKKAGIEINPHAREIARELGIEVYDSVEDVPGKFDKIISSHALEHVPHPRQAILKLKDKLKDQDSRLMLLLPLDDWRSRSNRRYRTDDMNMHLHTWTPQLLGNLLNTCGLRVEHLRIITHAWPPRKEFFWRLSPRLFHVAARIWSVLNKQRQLFVIAALK